MSHMKHIHSEMKWDDGATQRTRNRNPMTLQKCRQEMNTWSAKRVKWDSADVPVWRINSLTNHLNLSKVHVLEHWFSTCRMHHPSTIYYGPDIYSVCSVSIAMDWAQNLVHFALKFSVTQNPFVLKCFSVLAGVHLHGLCMCRVNTSHSRSISVQWYSVSDRRWCICVDLRGVSHSESSQCSCWLRGKRCTMDRDVEPWPMELNETEPAGRDALIHR